MNYKSRYFESIKAASTIMQIIEERGWLYNEVVEIYLGFSKVIEKCENLITEYDIAPESTYRKAYSMLTSEVERILLYCATCNTLLTIQHAYI